MVRNLCSVLVLSGESSCCTFDYGTLKTYICVHLEQGLASQMWGVLTKLRTTGIERKQQWQLKNKQKHPYFIVEVNFKSFIKQWKRFEIRGEWVFDLILSFFIPIVWGKLVVPLPLHHAFVWCSLRDDKQNAVDFSHSVLKMSHDVFFMNDCTFLHRGWWCHFTGA